MAVAAANERQRLDYRLGMWAAWHGAYFVRSGKRFPSLSKALHGLDKRTVRKMSPEMMLQSAEMMIAAFGGKDLRRSKPH